MGGVGSGRRPRPTALKLLDGERRTARVNYAEPRPREALPECPYDAGDELRAIWDYTVAELDVMGVVKAVDRDTLYGYCAAVVQLRRAAKVAEKSPPLTRNLAGERVKNPAIDVLLHTAEAVRKFAQEFGLTPSARSRLTADSKAAPDTTDGNPFAASG